MRLPKLPEFQRLRRERSAERLPTIASTQFLNSLNFWQFLKFSVSLWLILSVSGEVIMSREQRYISYLLRLWQTESGGERVWRASLESPHTGERKSFASLTDLFTFLEQETGHGARGQITPKASEKGGDAEQVDF